MSTELVDLMQVGLLSWARLDADLTLEDAAARICAPPDLLAAWEDGRIVPTLPDLKRLARAYGRTTGIFFLPQPPLESRWAPAE
ncbi:MAG: helix-turn-helix transcriptional regulator [Alsobacter sp.]